MIPKIIHYCWFGGAELPVSVRKNILSWKKYCPNYEIKRWDEKNYDVNKEKYTKLAYNAQQYAFLTDYARLDIIYNEGGVYLDTDVELIQSLDNILKRGPFMAFEQVGRVNTGIGFAAEVGNEVIKKNKTYYENKEFLNKNGEFCPEICVKITTSMLIDNGLNYRENKYQNVGGINIYPTEYFSPKKMGTSIINITSKTVGIHHYESSWYRGSKGLKKLNYYLIPVKEFVKYKLLRKKLYE